MATLSHGWGWFFGEAWSLGHYPRNKVVQIDLAVPFFPAYSFISIYGIYSLSGGQQGYFAESWMQNTEYNDSEFGD